MSTSTSQLNGPWDAIVIGAGHNGLASAALLAQRGRRVLVVESRDTLGGIAAREQFTLPLGSSTTAAETTTSSATPFNTTGALVDSTTLDPQLVTQLQLCDRGLELRDATPVFVPEVEGRGLLLAADPQQWTSELQQRNPHDAEQLPHFLRERKQLCDALRPLLREPALQLTSLDWRDAIKGLRLAWGWRRDDPQLLPRLLRVLPMSLNDWLDEFFEDRLLKAAIAAPALLHSMVGPRSAGTVGQWLWQECLRGQEVVGGGASCVDALLNACREEGVEFSTHTRVTQLLIRDDRVRGIALSDGMQLHASVVICSCDPASFLNLLPHTTRHTSFDGELERWSSRGSTSLAVIASSQPLEFAQRPQSSFERIRVVSSLDELERGADRMKYDEWGASPYLEVSVPTVSQPALAPAGQHLIQVWAQYTPYAASNAENCEQLKQSIVAQLSRFCPTLESSLLHIEVRTPPLLERHFHLSGGHLYHGEHRLDQFLFQRPSPECSHHRTPILGLFMAGSGTHPGGGLSGTPGRLAADRVSKSM